ncbi:MAG: class C sortase, partial [Alphaproteobacteria bacterium]|nr:class C sortase [Alphaproteobacteria bacterium]
KGVGHLENTSLPIGGESTHCILTGHTGLSRAEIFTKLDELEINEYFYINTLNEKLIYKINQIKVVLPTETEDLQIIEGKDLVTLVTCTPYGINTHRLLVQGERTKEVQAIDEDNLKEDTRGEENSNNYNFYWIGSLYGLIILLIIIFCCILFNYVVKYITRK